MALGPEGLDALIRHLRSDGHQVLGPTIRVCTVAYRIWNSEGQPEEHWLRGLE